MIAPGRTKPLSLLAGLVITLLFCFYYRNTSRIYIRWTAPVESHFARLPANRTLGFGAVVVVSREGSERRRSLLQAANVTDFDVTIPQQPQWTEADVEKFRNGEREDVQHGSILAWMGHLHALRWFLDSGLETTLILEDDVDWDVRLRSVQIPLAASAARTLMPPKQVPSLFRRPDRNHTQYWGDHGAWDLLYLGHCGDYLNEVTYEGLVPSDKPFTLNDVAHIVYDDPTLPARSELHPFTQDLFSALGMPPEHARAFHRSKYPLCSFGYAVTRPAAELLLKSLAPPKLKPKGPRAFDVALLHGCRKGYHETNPVPSRWRLPSQISRGLRCYTLNSELFHHMPGASEIAKIGKELGEETGQGLSPVDWAGQSQAVWRNETTNIGCGFWSGTFAFADGDEKRLEFLREEVGRKGRCLKHGRDGP